MRIERLESRRLLSGGPHGGGGTAHTGTTNATGATTITAGTLNLAGANTVFIKSGTLVLFNNIVHKPGETIDAGGVKVSVSSKGTLVIEGSTFNDSITVSTNKKSYTINVYGTPTFFFSRNEIKRIRIEGGAGKDTLSFSGSHPDVPVTLLGGAGNDTIRSSPGTTLIGGDGDDNLSAAGVQTFFSTNTDDTVTFRAKTTVYNTTGTTSAVVGRQLQPGFVYNSAGSANFVVIGTSDLDTGSLIEGGNGNDTITASAGPDTINGGRGTDAITRTVFNDAVISFDDDISPGDTVDSIEAFKILNANSSNRFDVINGVITVHPQQ